jgi:hypothetical protein
MAQSFATNFTIKIWKFGEFLIIEMLTCDKFQVEQMESCGLLAWARPLSIKSLFKMFRLSNLA